MSLPGTPYLFLCPCLRPAYPLNWNFSISVSAALGRPAPAMPEAAVFQPSRDCERALRQPLNWRKGPHYTTLRSSPPFRGAPFGSFCGVGGGFFKKSPLIILPYNDNLIRDTITISEATFENRYMTNTWPFPPIPHEGAERSAVSDSFQERDGRRHVPVYTPRLAPGSERNQEETRRSDSTLDKSPDRLASCSRLVVLVVGPIRRFIQCDRLLSC